jgi:hypothetical protein
MDTNLFIKWPHYLTKKAGLCPSNDRIILRRRQVGVHQMTALFNEEGRLVSIKWPGHLMDTNLPSSLNNAVIWWTPTCLLRKIMRSFDGHNYFTKKAGWCPSNDCIILRRRQVGVHQMTALFNEEGRFVSIKWPHYFTKKAGWCPSNDRWTPTCLLRKIMRSFDGHQPAFFVK